MTYDPRLIPMRPDLAAAHLKGKVEAARFVEGTLREVVDAQAPVRRSPSPDAPYETEALKGERVTVYETTEEGWSWGQLESDGYVGWLPANALAAPGPAPTHRVSVLRTLVFPGLSIKLPPLEALSFGTRVAITRIEDTLAVTASGGAVPAGHLAPLRTTESDPVAVAEKFLNVPYLWGGKTSFGIDCSGLVQTALAACDIPCPRDSDMQERDIGTARPLSLSEVRRGDLLFWKGHVAMVCDWATIIHANAHHMAVALEPMREAVDRIRAAGSELIGIRRP